MMKRILASIITGTFPLLVLAQAGKTYSPVPYGGGGLVGMLYYFGDILSMLVPFIISIAVVWFIWNVLQYTIAGNEEKKKTAKEGMIWGIVGIFVMVSVWGLVRILQSTFGLDNTLISAPKIEIPGN